MWKWQYNLWACSPMKSTPWAKGPPRRRHWRPVWLLLSMSFLPWWGLFPLSILIGERASDDFIMRVSHHFDWCSCSNVSVHSHIHFRPNESACFFFLTQWIYIYFWTHDSTYIYIFGTNALPHTFWPMNLVRMHSFTMREWLPQVLQAQRMDAVAGRRIQASCLAALQGWIKLGGNLPSMSLGALFERPVLVFWFLLCLFSCVSSSCLVVCNLPCLSEQDKKITQQILFRPFKIDALSVCIALSVLVIFASRTGSCPAWQSACIAQIPKRSISSSQHTSFFVLHTRTHLYSLIHRPFLDVMHHLLYRSFKMPLISFWKFWKQTGIVYAK